MHKTHFILPLLTFLINISVCKAQNTDDLIPVCLDGKWGYIDTNGIMVIEPQFDESPIEESSEFSFIMRQEEVTSDTSKFVVSIIENGKYGFADRKTGKTVIKPQFDEVDGFHNGFYIVKIKTKDTIKVEYDLANDEMPLGTPIDYYVSAEGHTIYVYNGGFYSKYGYVSDKGIIAIKPQFDEVGWFNDNGFADVKKDEKWGIINKEGKFVLAPNYDHISHSDNCELICVKQNGKSRLINLRGETLADLELEPREIKELIEHDGLSLIVRDNNLPIPIKKGENKFDFIDINGKTVFSGEFDDVWIFYKGTTKFKKNGKWGVIDSTGKIITEPRYDTLEYMYGDFYITKLGDKYGVVDCKGNVVLEPQFKKIDQHMEDGKYIKAIVEDGFGLYDTTGKMIIEPKFYNIKVKGNRIFVSYNDSFFHCLVGMYNLKGECIVEPKFRAVYNNSFFNFTTFGY